MQQFHHLYHPTAHRDYEAAFFHPLLKTPAVLQKLNLMWQVICRHLGWRFRPLGLREARGQQPLPIDEAEYLPVLEMDESEALSAWVGDEEDEPLSETYYQDSSDEEENEDCFVVQ